MRSTHRCLGLDGPGPQGFNERIHKKHVLPYLGSSQNYLFPMRIISQILTQPNFQDLSFQRVHFERLKSKYFPKKSPCKENINWNHPKCSAVSNDVHPGFTFPNYHQIHIPTITFHHPLHNQTKISVDSVLAQPFATLKNAIIAKQFTQTVDMD